MPLVVDGCVANFRDHIPRFQFDAVARIRFVDDQSLHGFIEFEELAQRGVFESLVFIEQTWFAIVASVCDVLQKQIDFLRRDNVADVVRLDQAAEGQSDHLVADDSRAAAVAGIDGGIDLNAEAGDGIIVLGKLDARNDSLGDGQTRAAFRVTVNHRGVFDFGKQLGARGAADACRKRIRRRV